MLKNSQLQNQSSNMELEKVRVCLKEKEAKIGISVLHLLFLVFVAIVTFGSSNLFLDKIKSLEKEQIHEENSVAALGSSLMLNKIYTEELEKVKLCLEEKEARVIELEKQGDEFVARETALNETFL